MPPTPTRPCSLEVKLLAPAAKLPTVAHPGEDLAYDVYLLNDSFIFPGAVAKLRTGIAVSAKIGFERVGLLMRDRSSMAHDGFMILGGVIDAGYIGELHVQMTYVGTSRQTHLKAGTKIAQLIPMPVYTGKVIEVTDLPPTARGDKGFGSSGK